MRKTALSVCVLLAALIGASRADYRIDWYSTNCGGGLVEGGSYKLNSSVGQTAAGFVANTTFLHWIGFWAGDVPTPVAAATLSAVKTLSDGSFISLSGKIATTAETDFASFFYVEEADRSSGIRIAVPAGPISGLLRGSEVNLIGTLGTTSEGERYLTGPIVVIVSTKTPLTPLGMPNLSVGGGDLGDPALGLGQYGVAGGVGLNNVGLFVKTWGRVIDAGTGYLVIDDGSATPVRVDTSGMSSLPGVDDWVRVMGISSLHKPGDERLRLVLPRERTDIE